MNGLVSTTVGTANTVKGGDVMRACVSLAFTSYSDSFKIDPSSLEIQRCLSTLSEKQAQTQTIASSKIPMLLFPISIADGLKRIELQQDFDLVAHVDETISIPIVFDVSPTTCRNTW